MVLHRSLEDTQSLQYVWPGASLCRGGIRNANFGHTPKRVGNSGMNVCS